MFVVEEEIHRLVGYPKKDAHKADHAAFVQQLNRAYTRTRFLSHPEEKSLAVVELITTIQFWFDDHFFLADYASSGYEKNFRSKCRD